MFQHDDKTSRSVPSGAVDPVRVDCDSCVVRGPSACGDCVVTVLLGAPPAGVHIDVDERAALDVLAQAGVVPPLRLVTAVSPDPQILAG
ncbi:hypothetical protein [Aeromicrobium sp. CF3.5]|uniref:hypothetical protein n=1 Tax=Aeromicrobium sp. CF3.5 TaxID=3373078 RepID=UPI003EE817E1